MNFYALARQFVCLIVAATLSLTVSVVERMLPQRPEWLEKIALLEAQFRAISAGRGAEPATGAAGSGGAHADEPNDPVPGHVPTDLQGLVDGYAKLLNFTQHVKVRGLMLDADFCERVEREWSVKTLLSYMLSAENSLKEQAGEAHAEAAKLLSGHGNSGPAAS